MRISDWSSDVCSSDLPASTTTPAARSNSPAASVRPATGGYESCSCSAPAHGCARSGRPGEPHIPPARPGSAACSPGDRSGSRRSEEHTSELQSLMRNSYAVFCLKKKKNDKNTNTLIVEHIKHDITHSPFNS